MGDRDRVLECQALRGYFSAAWGILTYAPIAGTDLRGLPVPLSFGVPFDSSHPFSVFPSPNQKGLQTAFLSTVNWSPFICNFTPRTEYLHDLKRRI